MRNSIRTLLGVAGLLVGCSGSGSCPVLPCALSIAVLVDVTSMATGAGIPGAFVQVGGGTPIACNQASGFTCPVPGGAGTYQLVIGAPGFQSVNQSVTVTALGDPNAVSGCGCATAVTQHLSIALVATP